METLSIGARVMIVGNSFWHDFMGIFTEVVYHEDLDRYLFMVELDDGRVVSVENPGNLHVII